MSENSTSLIDKSGRQRFSPMACLTPISPTIVARADAQARFISIVSMCRVLQALRLKVRADH